MIAGFVKRDAGGGVDEMVIASLTGFDVFIVRLRVGVRIVEMAVTFDSACALLEDLVTDGFGSASSFRGLRLYISLIKGLE